MNYRITYGLSLITMFVLTSEEANHLTSIYIEREREGGRERERERNCSFLATTKQLYEWYSPSVRPSVYHIFFTMFPSSYHHELGYYH